MHFLHRLASSLSLLRTHRGRSGHVLPAAAHTNPTWHLQRYHQKERTRPPSVPHAPHTAPTTRTTSTTVDILISELSTSPVGEL